MYIFELPSSLIYCEILDNFSSWSLRQFQRIHLRRLGRKFVFGGTTYRHLKCDKGPQVDTDFFKIVINWLGTTGVIFNIL